MKRLTLTFVGLLISLVAVAAENTDDPLLDARLDVMTLKLRFTEKHPKLILARMRLKDISRTFSESPAEYRTHLQARIRQAGTEESELRMHYTKTHPKMIAVEAMLAFLRSELQRTEGTSA